jgi:hypothetical protein
MAAGAEAGQDRETVCAERLTPLPVLVDGLPRMTGELVEALLRRDPLAELHRHAGAPQELEDTLDRLGIRMLIVGLVRLHAADAALARRPALKVLVVAGDGSEGELHEFVPVRRRLGEISAGTLERALREAAAAWPPVWERA